MSLLRYALPALAAISSASAGCSISGTTTLQNSGDAQAITSCSTFTGNIAIATGTSDSIALDGISRIEDGGISIQDAPNITSLSGSDLQTIDDAFNLNNVQTLQTLSFPQLSEVGSIEWLSLPNLATLDMATEIQDTDALNIQNTFLSSLQGINLKRCNSFILANNPMLQDVTLQLQNVTGAISLESNGDRLNVDFPNLQSAQNITFRNVPSVSIPSLAMVNGSLGFIENQNLGNISCPNLTAVALSLSINTNDQLNSISFPLLKTVHGAVNVQNNTELKAINFPSLTVVSGAFDAFGTFSNISLPKISDIRGAFNVQSTEDLTAPCDTFNNEKGSNNAIKGTYQCSGKQSNPSDSTPTDTSSSGSSGKTGAASHLDMPSVTYTGVLGVLAAIVGLW